MAFLSQSESEFTSMEGTLCGCCILVADDESIIAMDLAEQLEAAGAVVVGPAATVERAAALIATKKVDAALLDIKLGEQMVYPIADALIARGVPFIFITGCDLDTISDRYAGIPRYEKPFVAKSVIDALKQAAPATRDLAADDRMLRRLQHGDGQRLSADGRRPRPHARDLAAEDMGAMDAGDA